MTEGIRDLRVSLDGNAGWIVYLLRSRELEGAEGLYFRVADAAASATKADHAVVVLPSRADTLRVVGCYGLPTKALEEFPAARGIVGREFRGGFQDKPYLIVDDISKDRDYYAFDDRVQSELLVPVFDADRKDMIAILNVEAHPKSHFTQKHAEILFRIGEIMAEHREHLLRMREIENQNAHLRLILEKIPDELLIIDKSYRVLYANEVKRDRFKRLGTYLKGPNGDVWHRLFRNPKTTVSGSDDACYRLIEDQPLGPCTGCVCDKAMRLKRSMQGIVYRPQQMKAVVELSAAPLSVDGEATECVELTRDVTQRESVIGVAPRLLADCDQDEFLQDMVNRLHEELRYNRVRLYSLQGDPNLLTGVTYAGTHRRIERADFPTLKIEVPEKLRLILAKTKAGLMSLEGSAEPDDCYGYWSVGLSRNELTEFIDPDGRLELADVRELAVVPVSTKHGRWLLFLDSGTDPKRRFNSDDLQALTVFSKIASATLEVVRQNRVRFKYATLGRTSVGLRDTLGACLSNRCMGERWCYNAVYRT